MARRSKALSAVWTRISRRNMKRTGYFFLCLLAASCCVGEVRECGAQFVALFMPTNAQTSSEARWLEPGSVVSDVVSVGGVREYKLELLAGQRVRIEISKGDLMVTASMCAPTGERCLEVIGRRFGRFDLCFSAEVSASHRLEIRSLEKGGGEREYKLGVTELRAAAPREQLWYKAVSAVAEAEQLRERQNASSQIAALAKYGDAQGLWESVGELNRAAEALCDMGDVCFALSQYRQALAHYVKSISLSERSGDRPTQLEALNSIGYTNIYLGGNQEALRYARKVLDIVERLGPDERASVIYRRAEAQALNSIGEVYYSFGELRKSIDMFERTLAISTEVGDRRGEALSLLNLGYSYSDLGDLRNATGYYQRSLGLWQLLGDERCTALAQTALGGVHSILGEEQLALDLHKRAVDHFLVIGNQQGQAAALNGVARAYEDLNDYQAALDNYQEALRLYEAIGNRDFAALNKFYVGKVLYQMRETERAFSYYQDSLGLSREVGDRVIEAHALKGLGTVYFSRGDIRGALAQFGTALRLYRQLGNLRSQAYTLNDIGHAYLSSREDPKALASYRQALPLMRDTGDRRGEALTLFNTAQAESDRGNLMEALSLVEESIATSESLRTKIRNSQLRSSYFASVHQQYELCIDVLMQLHSQYPEHGFAAKALVVSEQARARSLLDSLLEGKIEPRRDISSDLLRREQELLQVLDEKAEYQVRLLNGKHTEEEATHLAREIRSLTIEYQDARAQLREQSPRCAILTQPEQLAAEVLQRVLKDDDTLLIEFALGDQRSYVWAVSADQIESHELPDRWTIESLARRVYELLTTRQALFEKPSPTDENVAIEADSKYLEQAAVLSQMLLGPVAGRLDSKRLLIVSDGFLQQIPFEALPTPASSSAPFTVRPRDDNPDLLCFNHEIVGLPSALTLAAIRHEVPSPEVAAKIITILADPVFDKDDPRVLALRADGDPVATADIDTVYLSRALRDFNDRDNRLTISRLSSTLREAKAILAVAPSGEGVVATGFAANRDEVMSGKLRDYRIIHFATHGILNIEHPELSGVILSLVDEHGNSRNGFLRLHDIYNLDLSADLVVLSACRTGLGKDVRGEGVVGLTTGFMYAGAKSVVASLWKVDDEATQVFMGNFYTALLKDGLAPSAALRKAKGEMWRVERWRAPFYWAAFVLEGEYAGGIRIPQRTSPRRILTLVGAILLVAAGAGVLIWRLRRRLI